MLRAPDKWDDPLEGKSCCAFKLISKFLDKREHSRTKPTQRQRAPPRYNDLCPSKSLATEGTTRNTFRILERVGGSPALHPSALLFPSQLRQLTTALSSLLRGSSLPASDSWLHYLLSLAASGCLTGGLRAKRKPLDPSRYDGSFARRSADRQYAGGYQLPPRSTRCEP